MVLGAIPIAKLGILLLNKISKPLANAAKRRAVSNPFFRNYICIPPAQFYHWAEVRMRMLSMGLGQPTNVTKLNEKMAIELGAELLGEFLLLAIAIGILVYEYRRSSEQDAATELKNRLQLRQIKSDLNDLIGQNTIQENYIAALIKKLNAQFSKEAISQNSSLPLDLNSVPEHHRIDRKRKKKISEESAASPADSIKTSLFSFVDIILEEIDDE